LISPGTRAGTKATRRSPGKVSFVTATIMGAIPRAVAEEKNWASKRFFGSAGRWQPKLCQMAAPLKTLAQGPRRDKIGPAGILAIAGGPQVVPGAAGSVPGSLLQ
jgi:hypothetical protein